MIITVTPNPAIDRTLVIPALHPGQVHRVTHTVVAAGGKGLNVARALKTLGGEPLAMGLLGGYNGRLLAKTVASEAIAAAWTWLDTETRTCVILVTENQDATVINEPGPTISIAGWAHLVANVERQAHRAQAVCLCGSLPPGCPATAPQDLITAVKQSGCPIWVDTSGPFLGQAVRAQPDGIKVNAHEAAELLGHSLTAVTDNELVVWGQTAVQQIRQMGIANVILTLGSQGAIFANRDGLWWGQPPPISVVSSVGSGDAFLAGLVLHLNDPTQAVDALRSAIAAGTSNALTVGAGILNQTTYTTLRAQTIVSSLT